MKIKREQKWRNVSHPLISLNRGKCMWKKNVLMSKTLKSQRSPAGENTLLRLLLNTAHLHLRKRVCNRRMCDSLTRFPMEQDILGRALKSRHKYSGSGFLFLLWVWLESDTEDISHPMPDILWIKCRTCNAENEKRAMKSPKSAHTHTRTHKRSYLFSQLSYFNISNLKLSHSFFNK